MKAILNYIATTTLALTIAAAISARPAGAAVTYQVTIDTSSVQGTTGFIDLQFNPGNSSSQPATAQITNFATDGSVAVGFSSTGSVSGTLPGTVTFTNSTALNELFQGITFGKKITFLVSLSGPAIDSPSGTSNAGTTFSIGFYDSGQNSILTNQALLSGSAGQVDINLNGSTTATAFPNASQGPSVLTFVANPGFFITDWWWYYTYPN